MWYVVQVVGGREASAVRRIGRLCDAGTFERVFVPQREFARKSGGQWSVGRAVLFPGYVFVDTAEPERFAAELSRVSGLARLLASGDGDGGRRFIPISDDERALICAFTGEDGGVMRMSEAVAEGDRIRVVSGPLAGREAMVAKIDRHKRLAWIEAEMFGRRLRFKVGLEVVRKS